MKSRQARCMCGGVVHAYGILKWWSNVLVNILAVVYQYWYKMVVLSLNNDALYFMTITYIIFLWEPVHAILIFIGILMWT